MPRTNRQDAVGLAGLRTRFRPRMRLGRGLLRIAPWVDVLLLLVFFILLSYQYVLQPGVIVRLPESTFREGSRPIMIAVVISVPSATRTRDREIVFFDDERFMVESQSGQEKLQAAIGLGARRNPEADLVIQAADGVRYGTVMRLMEMAYASGIEHVNLAADAE